VAQATAAGGAVPSLDYWYVDSPAEWQTSVALQAAWQTAGVAVKPTGLHGARAQRPSFQGSSGRQPAVPHDVVGRLPLHGRVSVAVLPVAEGAPDSYTSYSNPAVDELLLKARSTGDETQRRNLYAMAEKGILADAPVIPLSFGRDFRVLNNRVRDQELKSSRPRRHVEGLGPAGGAVSGQRHAERVIDHAWRLLEQQRAKDARRLLEELLAGANWSRSTKPTARHLLGSVLEELGDTAGMVREWLLVRGLGRGLRPAAAASQPFALREGRRTRPGRTARATSAKSSATSPC